MCVSVSLRLYENKGESDFMESLRSLFASFNAMMNSNADGTGGVKVSLSEKLHHEL